MAGDHDHEAADGNEKNSQHQHSTDGSCCRNEDNKERVAPTIFDAVKAGVLIPVQTFFEVQGPAAFSQKDEKGYTPAHWACLGGHTTILRFIIESKGPIDEPAENDVGQKPIHWACVNGHVAIVDILQQAGVSLDVADYKGCTPLIVACQYGKTVLAGYLMGKGARLQLTDSEGDNALHWAAFKGFSELCRLLIYSGFNPRQIDKWGQTPLHLACISGNLTLVKELIEEEQVEMNLPDKNGKTPLNLAIGRKHDTIIDYLKQETNARKSLIPKISLGSIVFGPPGNSKGPLLFFIVSLLCWGYPMYLIKCLPVTWYELQSLHIIFMATNAMMWFFLYHANGLEPGFLPRNTTDYDMAIKQVAHYDQWKHGKNPLTQLCHTCRTVKPVRSKHCRVCNRCVKEFDHHCPYIYNCVGYNNRVWFLGFVMLVSVNCLITVYFGYYVLSINGWDWAVVLGLIEAVAFSGISFGIAFLTFLHAAWNLTTNERINSKRYEYLKEGRGHFYNPFNRGVKINLLEFFHLKQGLNEDEVKFLNVTVV